MVPCSPAMDHSPQTVLGLACCVLTGTKKLRDDERPQDPSGAIYERTHVGDHGPSRPDRSSGGPNWYSRLYGSAMGWTSRATTGASVDGLSPGFLPPDNATHPAMRLRPRFPPGKEMISEDTSDQGLPSPAPIVHEGSNVFCQGIDKGHVAFPYSTSASSRIVAPSFGFFDNSAGSLTLRVGAQTTEGERIGMAGGCPIHGASTSSLSRIGASKIGLVHTYGTILEQTLDPERGYYFEGDSVPNSNRPWITQVEPKQAEPSSPRILEGFHGNLGPNTGQLTITSPSFTAGDYDLTPEESQIWSSAVNKTYNLASEQSFIYQGDDADGEVSTGANLSIPVKGAVEAQDQFLWINQSSSGDLVQYVPKKKQRVRGAYRDVERREEVKLTRDYGACYRCQVNKIPCSPGIGTCETCAFKWTSFRTWYVPCIRDKLINCQLHRCADTTWRWASRSNYDPSFVRHLRPYTFFIGQGYAHPFRVTIARYDPIVSDIVNTSWKWAVKDGIGVYHMPPLAVSNRKSLKDNLGHYIVNVARAYVIKLGKSDCDISYDILLKALEFSSSKKSPIVQRALWLWTGTRLIEDQWQLLDGEHMAAGISLNQDCTAPFYGMLPVTPFMDFQIDELVISHLRVLAEQVTKELQTRIREKRIKWMEFFLVIFVLLNNLERCFKHDHKYARKHAKDPSKLNADWTDENLIGGFVHTADALVAYFHAVNKCKLPFRKGFRFSDTKNLECIDDNDLSWLQGLRQKIENMKLPDNGSDLLNQKKYDTFYWCSRLFREGCLLERDRNEWSNMRHGPSRKRARNAS